MAIKPHKCQPGCYHGNQTISIAVSRYPEEMMPGKRRTDQQKTCDWCKGAGVINVPKKDKETGERYTEMETCNRCRGTGRI